MRMRPPEYARTRGSIRTPNPSGRRSWRIPGMLGGLSRAGIIGTEKRTEFRVILSVELSPARENRFAKWLPELDLSPTATRRQSTDSARTPVPSHSASASPAIGVGDNRTRDTHAATASRAKNRIPQRPSSVPKPTETHRTRRGTEATAHPADSGNEGTAEPRRSARLAQHRPTAGPPPRRAGRPAPPRAQKTRERPVVLGRADDHLTPAGSRERSDPRRGAKIRPAPL